MEEITNDLVEQKTEMKEIEENGVEIKMQIESLQQKLLLCENKYGINSRKCEELESRYQQEKENLDMLENTLHQVSTSKERVKALIQNFIPSFQFENDFDS